MSHPRARLSSVALIFTALFVLPAGPALGESVMIKRKYVSGRTSYIENQVELVQDISGLPMPALKLQSDQLYGLWERVESSTKDKTKIVLTYDRAARKVNAPMMGDVEFDTDDPEYEEAAPQLGTVLKPMIGMAMTMEVDKDGKVISFSGMDAVNERVSKLAIASMHWEQMKEEFTDERGKETWGTQPLLIYPNKKVKKGDTWKASSFRVRPRIGTIVTDYQYKFDRIGKENGRKIAVISYTAKVSLRPDAEKTPDAEAEGAKKKAASSDKPDKKDTKQEGSEKKEEAKDAEPDAEVSGSMSGMATYDVKLGRIVKRNIEGKVDIKVPLSKVMPNVPTGDEPKLATFKITIKSATSILSEEDRNKQKAEARKKAELRRKAEEEEEEEEEEDDD